MLLESQSTANVMQSKIRRTVVGAVAVLCLGLPAAGASAGPRHHPHHHHPKRLELPADYAAWQRVAVCESNSNWEILGAVYPDPLGITAANWAHFGRLRFGHAPAPEAPTSSASRAQRIEAIEVGDEILRDSGASMPDQHGCQIGGW